MFIGFVTSPVFFASSYVHMEVWRSRMMREGVASTGFAGDFFVMGSCWFADHCLENSRVKDVLSAGFEVQLRPEKTLVTQHRGSDTKVWFPNPLFAHRPSCNLPEAAAVLGWAQSTPTTTTPSHWGCPHLVKQLNKFHLLEYVFPLDPRMTVITCLCGMEPFLVIYNSWVMPIPYRCTCMFAHEPPIEPGTHSFLPENCSCA